MSLYLASILAGALAGLAFPGLADPLERTITPVLGLLLYVTFLGVTFTSLGRAFRARRFLLTLLALNFLIVPLVAFVLSRVVADDEALLFGVLFVLLTPCVDYVLVFSGLAGGNSARLVAATPLLMLAQIVLLPVYLALMVGPDGFASVEPAPFIEAFLVLIVMPLAAAAATQLLAARAPAVVRVQSGALRAMVPLMMLTLAVVVGSQIHAVAADLPLLLRVVPLFVAFLIVMPFVGAAVSRLARLDLADARAVTFSGATRNSLVVLPLALALPVSLSFAAVVIVTQTLVELLGMVAYVKLIPRLLPDRSEAAAAR